jgi:deoxyribodipyrimidine photo-lyase
MAKPVVLYIFHRDLRLYDNKTLIDAAAYARQHKAALLPVFIFTPSQVTEKNPYKSNASIQFMIESLEHLSREIASSGGQLQSLHGENLEVVASLLEHSSIIAIFETVDYTPYAKKRQSEMLTLANYHEIEYFPVHDTYLTTPGSVLNGSGKPYQKFTPFYEAAKKQQVPKPLQKPRTIPWFSGHIPNTIDPKSIYPPPRRLHVHGGRAEGLKLLKKVPSIDYAAVHDVPSKETTNLSAHHHYGTIGIRETFAAASGKTDLQRQLYWRDFYGQICNFFEDLYGIDPYKFQAEGQPGYAQWKKDRAVFNAWCEGRTGVPIVDAAMQQLLQTGYMHNRSRLIVSNWLVKDKKIYWRWGERFFAQHLVDYDFAQNFGNWCWVASVLPFSQAPFRKLDAQTQANKFDKEHIYVDKWNPSTK